jgi:hypothetical protein
VALSADILADAVAIINDWGEDVSFDGAAVVKGVVTEQGLHADRPGLQALGTGGRGQARRVKLEIVSTSTTPAIGQNVTISGTTYKVEAFLRRTWITEVDLVAIEAV